jgi:cell surface hyaluronidase
MKRALILGLLAASLAACGNDTSTKPPDTVTPPPGTVTPPPPPSPVVQTNATWSDPKSWTSGKVPVAGEAVVIPTGKSIMLDISPPALKSLEIQGALKFAEKDLELTAGWIMLHGGQLQIGSTQIPFTKQATITLTGANTGTDNMGMGEKFLGVMMGGQLDLHGGAVKSWTRLSSTAAKDATTIVVENSSGWNVGDGVAIASTDYDTAQSEEFTITAKSGNTLTLSGKLKYMHYGQAQPYGGKTLESRAEVALLRRNIVIRGEEASSKDGFGGHLMVMDTGKARIENVELTRRGQLKTLKRYPIHFHMQGDNGEGSYVINSVLHHNFNRAITIHSSGKLLIQNNAAFDTVGHTYFLEDGGEAGNTLEGNLGFLTRCTLQKETNGNQKGCYSLKDGDTLLPSDKRPATFWITNPANSFRNNVAAGSDGIGFWFALPKQPTGPSASDARFNIMYPRRTPLTEFKGNIAHSNGDTGLHVDDGPKPDNNTEVTSYQARANPTPPAQGQKDSDVVPVVFQDFTAYRNRTRGVWLRGNAHTLRGAVLADNGIGATFASSQTLIEDSVVIGETANLGNPGQYEKKGLDNRSLPYPYGDGTEYGSKHPIRGYEFYDGQVGAKNVTFVNFQPNALRGASALGYLRFTAFHVDPGNSAEGLKFENANRVFFDKKLDNTGKPVELIAPNDDGMDGYRSAVFLDKDGSVTGSSGRSVVVDNPFLIDGNCTGLNTDWQARVCNNQYGRFTFRNEDATKAEISPVTLTRLEGANPQHKLWGTPNGAANDNFESRVIVGRSIKLELNGAMPNRFKVSVYDRNTGDWVRVSIPWSAAAPSIYRDYWIDNRNKLAAAASLTDLEASTGDKFFLENGTLHLKLQVKAETGYTKDYALLDVCQTDLCK